MYRPPPVSTLTHTLFPYPSLFRSCDPQEVRLAVHVLSLLAAEGLEVIRAAMRVYRGLIGIALHEHVQQRIVRPVQGVELAARLVGVDGGDELLRHLDRKSTRLNSSH